MCPISNSPEMLLAQALKNDTVQATAGARLTTHNAFTMSRDGCFWSGSDISVIVEAGRFTWFVWKQPFLAHLHVEQPGNNELLSLNQVPEAYGLLPWRSDTRLYCEMAYIVL
jgi:hypothetical protein